MVNFQDFLNVSIYFTLLGKVVPEDQAIREKWLSIVKNILRKIATGDCDNLGDTSTLLDPTVVEEIKANAL